jgi:hemerythrin-like domain-containing protein
LGINLSAFENLMEEHAIILRAISVLNQSTIKLKSKVELPSGFFDTFLEVIQKFADKCHHGKEEVVLFPLIKQRSCSQSEIIPELLQDHQRGRDFIAGFREAIASHNYSAAVENADAYSQLLTSHIKTENKVFPHWFEGLGDNDKEDLFEQFEEIEAKVIGTGKHEEYIRKIEDLKSQLQQAAN